MKQITFYHQGEATARCYVADDDIRAFTHLMNYLFRAAMMQAYSLQYETEAGQERKWRVTVKERNAKHPITTTHHGNLDKNGIIDLFTYCAISAALGKAQTSLALLSLARDFGLHHSDVEWYRIEEVVTVEEKEN